MLRLKEVEECLYPETLEEAVDLLRNKGEKVEIVGGGLHITVFPNPQIKTLIFLDKLGLSYVNETEDLIKIGATTTISYAANNSIIKNAFDGEIAKSLSNIASELLRNQITFGGSVAQREPYSDIATLLLALDATVTIFDGSEKNIPLKELYEGNFRATLKNAIIKEVSFKKEKDYQFRFERHTRNATDIALLNMAMKVKVENGLIYEVSISYGSRPMPAVRFTKLEEFLKGKNIDEAVKLAPTFAKENAEVSGDVRLSEDYRRSLMLVFTKRMFESIGR